MHEVAWVGVFQNIKKDRMVPVDKNTYSHLMNLFNKSMSDTHFVEDKAQISEDLSSVINEIQIYQGELEMQNDELRRVHKELEVNRNKYYDLFNQAPTSYFLLGEQFQIVEANLASLKLCGLTRPEIKNKLFLFLLRRQDHDTCIAYLNSVLANKKSEGITVQISQKDRPFRIVRLTGIASPYDVDSKQLLLSATDLTELKQTQNALSESENLYRTLVTSSQDHIFMLSLDGYFLTSNNNAPYLIDDEAAVIMGRHISDVYPHEHYPILADKIETIVHGGEQLIFDCMFSHHDNTLYLTYQLYPVYKDNNLWAIGGVCRDVTLSRKIAVEKEALEEKLRQSQKLESIGNLAGGIAHDFNNILSAILGFCELAIEQVEPGAPLAEDLNEIRNGGIRAKELVQQILSFARTSNKERSLVHLPPLVEETVKFIRSTTPTTIDINVTIESDGYIMANETEMHQVLMNLLTNGAQAMEESGGVLSIEVVDVYHNSAIDSKNIGQKEFSSILITISDTGSGIDPEIIDKVFEPYFTTKDVGKGSGMGLAVVHGIIKNCGGNISVSSVPGEGSSFIIRLPGCSHNQESMVIESEGVSGGEENILFVDDETAIARMAKKLLSQLGYSVEVTTDPFEALRIFRREPDMFDLIITDVTMPGMTGEQLALELMKVRPDIPVILSTGYSKKISEEDIAHLGIKAFTTKPFGRATLAAIIRKVLDGVRDVSKAG